MKFQREALRPDDAVWKVTRPNWSQFLEDTAAPAILLSLPQGDVRALAARAPGMRGIWSPQDIQPPSREILEVLEEAIEVFDAGVFIKVEPFSFKSSSRRSSDLRITKAGDFMRLMRDVPDRVLRAAEAAYKMEIPLTLALIEWRDIEPWSEFRMFFRMGEFCGVSQLNPNKRYVEISQSQVALSKAFGVFQAQVAQYLPIPDCALDIFAKTVSNGFEIELIEVNPFDERLERLLFEGQADQFDGTFRFNE